jgi:hypothetical protein
MIPETSEPTQQRISIPDHDEEERMAMEFYIACAPEDHPVIPGAGGFRKVRQARPDPARGRAAAFVQCISSWANRGGSSWRRFTLNREKRRFRQRIGTCSQNSRVQRQLLFPVNDNYSSLPS